MTSARRPSTEPVSRRPAARVVCVDDQGRILLLRWHDTIDHVVFWEPPGGGLEPGETPLEAARRELYEETSLPGNSVTGVYVTVYRRFRWLGTCYERHEPFFLSWVPVPPPVSPSGLTAEETGRFLGHGWLARDQIAALPDPVEPPDLVAVVARLLALDQRTAP